MKIEERIEQRKKIRAKQSGRLWRKNALKMLCAICDDYLEHRIRTDKVQEGILKDIEGDIAGINIAQGDMNIRSELDYTFAKEKVMSEETKLTHAAQVLLQGAEKAFEDGSRIRGVSLVKDCLVLLGNGYERLTTKAGFTEKEIEDMKQPAEQPTEITHVEKTHEGQKVTITPTPEQPESKPGAGIVSEPAEQESKDGAGIVSEPEKSQNKDGSGIA